MTILILTTDTPHHCFYLREIIKKYNNIKVFVETKKIDFPFKNNTHCFENKRETYELNKWFKGKKVLIDHLVDNFKFKDLNNKNAIKKINSFKPKLIISFGIGKLNKKTLKLISKNIYNLHGGNPDEYRGLDSHLWAIYHNDYKNIEVTLHKLTAELDSGGIFLKKKINLNSFTKIYHLRTLTTEICIKISFNLIKNLLNGKKILLKNKTNKSRYYSHMPLSIKNLVVDKFNKHINKLN